MYRALESERPDALFQDSFACALAGGQGRLLIEIFGADQQAVNAIAIRTYVIDELIGQLLKLNKIDTVLNLGAGLDTRPYRLALPSSLHWIEVDFSDILAYKEHQLQFEQPACSLERIGLDLTNVTLRNSLFSRVNAAAKQVLVITEGVLAYLPESQVRSLAIDLHQQPNFCWWIFELVAALVLQQAQEQQSQKLFRQYFTRGNTEPLFFALGNGVEFFIKFGWEVNQFRSLWEESGRLERRTVAATLLGLCIRHFTKRYWKAMSKQSGIALLERM
jgi:methyltransferase (TIGR00027 family)